MLYFKAQKLNSHLPLRPLEGAINELWSFESTLFVDIVYMLKNLRADHFYPNLLSCAFFIFFSHFEQLKKKTNFLLVQKLFFFSLVK